MSDKKVVFQSFYEWVLKFENVDHRIGDLARDAKMDKGFPRKATQLKDIKNHMVNMGACEEALEALNIAFYVYSDDMKPGASTLSAAACFNF